MSWSRCGWSAAAANVARKHATKTGTHNRYMGTPGRVPNGGDEAHSLTLLVWIRVSATKAGPAVDSRGRLIMIDRRATVSHRPGGRHMSKPEPRPKRTASRRTFLHHAAGLTAGIAASAAKAEPSETLLPTIKLGPHSVTRLIVGGNPV